MEQLRPGQLEPNAFELAILERIAGTHPSLRPHLVQLRIVSREFTGVGSYTNFLCEDHGSGAAENQYHMNGLITMPTVPQGIGAILFCKGGRPKVLETFTYGDDHWDGVFEGFSFEGAAQHRLRAVASIALCDHVTVARG